MQSRHSEYKYLHYQWVNDNSFCHCYHSYGQSNAKCGNSSSSNFQRRSGRAVERGGHFVQTTLFPPLQTSVNDFAVLAAPNSQTVTAGNEATYTVTVTPTGIFPQSVSLGSCSNLPAGAACTFSGNPIPNLNNGAQNRTLVITTTPRVTTPASLFHANRILYAFWFPISGLALIGAGATRRRRWLAGAFIICTLGVMVLQAGCGSKSGNTTTTTGTPAGSYSITMNATSGNATRSTAVTLVVE